MQFSSPLDWPRFPMLANASSYLGESLPISRNARIYMARLVIAPVFSKTSRYPTSKIISVARASFWVIPKATKAENPPILNRISSNVRLSILREKREERFKFRITNYELRITNYELRIN